jgi:4-methyl-5(b-hydroxyethyl)-thiazole monophosphate biosynthesis
MEVTMAAQVLVPVADGSEEIEAVTIIDVLRRAGADVTVASVDGLQITASRGVKLVADCLIGDCRERDYDLVVLPGGMPGAEHLRDNEILKAILLRQNGAGLLLGAICAAPAVVLESHGLLRNRKATCHPGHVRHLLDPSAADRPVVVDGNCVTSRGPGTAMAFALKLVEMLFGREKMKAVAAPMVID